MVLPDVNRRAALGAAAMLAGLSSVKADACVIRPETEKLRSDRLSFVRMAMAALLDRDEARFVAAFQPIGDGPAEGKAVFEAHFGDASLNPKLHSITLIDRTAFVAVEEAAEPDPPESISLCKYPRLHLFVVQLGGDARSGGDRRIAAMTHVGDADVNFGVQPLLWTA